MINLYQSLVNLNYFPCPLLKHQCAPLNLICCQSHCNQTLVCIHCQQQSHSDHQVLPLKTYLKKLVMKIGFNKQESFYVSWWENMQVVKQNLINSLEILKINLSVRIDQLIHQVKIQYDAYGKRMKEFMYMKSTVASYIKFYQSSYRKCFKQAFGEKVFQNQQQNQPEGTNFSENYYTRIENLNKGINSVLTLANVEMTTNEQEKLDEIDFQIENLGPKIKLLSQKYIQNCDKVQKSYKKSLSDLENLFEKNIQKLRQAPVFSRSTNFKFSWSEYQKALPISINGAIIQRKSGSLLQRFALCNESLQFFLDRRRNPIFIVKIVKLVGWIGLGICIRNKIISVGYKFQHENLGHGSYLISSNGYSWSSSVLSSNSSYSQFSFTTGDFVIVQYEQSQKAQVKFYVCNQETLKQKGLKPGPKKDNKYVSINPKNAFSKENKDMQNLKVYLSDLKLVKSLEVQESKDYCFCANLCSAGDSVEIIN